MPGAPGLHLSWEVWALTLWGPSTYSLWMITIQSLSSLVFSFLNVDAPFCSYCLFYFHCSLFNPPIPVQNFHLLNSFLLNNWYRFCLPGLTLTDMVASTRNFPRILMLKDGMLGLNRFCLWTWIQWSLLIGNEMLVICRKVWHRG